MVSKDKMSDILEIPSKKFTPRKVSSKFKEWEVPENGIKFATFLLNEITHVSSNLWYIHSMSDRGYQAVHGIREEHPNWEIKKECLSDLNLDTGLKDYYIITFTYDCNDYGVTSSCFRYFNAEDWGDINTCDEIFIWDTKTHKRVKPIVKDVEFVDYDS